MIPLIDKCATGTQLRRLMDTRGITVKDVQQYLELGSVQSIYHWLNRKPFGDSGRQILRAYYEIMQERWIA